MYLFDFKTLIFKNYKKVKRYKKQKVKIYFKSCKDLR